MKLNHLVRKISIICLLTGLVLSGRGVFVGQLPIARADSSELEVYTEVSLVSNPGWERTVTITDLSDEVQFKVNIKNLSGSTVSNVKVKFEPAAGFEFANDTVTVITNAGTNTYSTSDLASASGLNIGSLEPYSAAGGWDYGEVIFKVKLSFCPWTDLYRSGISANADQTGETVDQVDVSVNAACEGLSIEKLVSNTNNPSWKTQVSANQGDYVQYKIKLYNPNPLPMTEPRVKDILPDGFTLREDTVFLVFAGTTMSPNPQNGNIFGDGYLLSTNLDPYNSGDRPYWEVTYKAQVGDCPVEGEKVNNASAWTKWTDAVLAAAAVMVAECVEPTPGEASITINKKVVWNGSEHDSIERETHLFDPDESVVYKIYVKNEGDADAEGVKVTDYLPAYIRTLDGEDEKEFNIGTLAAGEEWSEEYTAKVLSDLPQNDRTQVNTARATADGVSSVEDSAHIWINGPEILAAEAKAATAEAPEAPAELPATGPAVPVALGLSGFLSLGFYLHRRLGLG